MVVNKCTSDSQRTRKRAEKYVRLTKFDFHSNNLQHCIICYLLEGDTFFFKILKQLMTLFN